MSEPAATSQEQKAGNKLPSVSPFFSSPTYTLIVISHFVSPVLSLSKFVCVHLRGSFARSQQQWWENVAQDSPRTPTTSNSLSPTYSLPHFLTSDRKPAHHSSVHKETTTTRRNSPQSGHQCQAPCRLMQKSPPHTELRLTRMMLLSSPVLRAHLCILHLQL